MLGKMETSYWGCILKNMMNKVPHDVATLFNLVKPKVEAEVEVLVGGEVDGAVEEGYWSGHGGSWSGYGGLLEQPRGFYGSGQEEEGKEGAYGALGGVLSGSFRFFEMEEDPEMYESAGIPLPAMSTP